MVKRLAAVASGATMLGATAMGALAAADLSNYPNMFVTDGTFNGFFVVGEKAASVDNLAMTDIAASMKVAKAGATTTTTVEGDAWLVGTSSKKFELANSNATDGSITGETFRDINNFVADEELSALADGKWATNEDEYPFNQYLYFDAEPEGTAEDLSRIVKYTENDQSKTADHLFIKNARQIARYRLEFTSNAQSDVTDSNSAADTTGTYLDDFEDTAISLMGKSYSVVQARRTDSGSDANQNGIKLLLMSGATSDTLLEGESKTYTVGDKTYDVTLVFVDSDEGKFTVNGEQTSKLRDGDTYVLKDKSEVGVSEILYQDYAGGVHSATFFLGARKVELRDDDVSNVASSHRLRVGSEDIDGADVIVEGSDTNVTFTITRLTVNQTSQDDYFVAAGGKLSDAIAAEGEEKEVLMDGSYDIEYKGLTEEKNKELKLKSSSAKRYKLQLFDGDGNQVDLPVAYATSAYNITLGEEANTKKLVINESDLVKKDDYFVVTGGTASDGSAKSYLMKYVSADRQDKSSPKIKFKNEGNGETLEYAVTSITAGTQFGLVTTVKVGGYSFEAWNASTTMSDDFNLVLNLDGSGAAPTSVAGVGVNFVDYYGSQWQIHDNSTTNLSTSGHVPVTFDLLNGSVRGSKGSDGQCTQLGNQTVLGCQDTVRIAMSVPNADDYDNVVPNTLILDLTATTDPEMRAALMSPKPPVTTLITGATGTGSVGITTLTPDGETDVGYAYTSQGAFLKFSTPSNDPQELSLTYPEKQRLPQVYVTSGATKSSLTKAGDLVAVTVVDATKLDSEVASATAQNLVVVGGPCVNTVAAQLLGNPADCTAGFTPGKARVKLWEHANGNMAMLVAGYSGEDTRLAGKVVAHRWKELSGDEVEVEGTTYSDATINAPAAASE